MQLQLDGDAKEGDLDAALDLEDDTQEMESWSDDPVRMYLTQMGEIPLLTRQQEINLARRIETTRTAFRRRLLACDYVIRVAHKILSRVHRGELPLIARCKCRSPTGLRKSKSWAGCLIICGLWTPCWPAMKKIIDSPPVARKNAQTEAAWARLGKRRRRAVMLVEELGLRTQRIEPMIGSLEELSDRIDELRSLLKRGKNGVVPRKIARKC